MLSSIVSHSLYYNFHFALSVQSKGEKLQFQLKDLKVKGFQTIVSLMAKQYETLVRSNMVGIYESRTLCFYLELLPESNGEFYCSD
ncbi:hypothetical protein A0J61_09189 [Choanephora cucurbitarum]|uniref:Uncharacterized protein n=1 Tax=Choanephora cucurbitarum TaxID=101091 RepID=A0A1C7N0X5_9FUNG|nr:hypothetical protein A0J61_09189 [Choanephora cucurbitarum]